MVELATALALLIGPAPSVGPVLAWGGATHAWAGGRGGIVATADGGKNWHVQFHRSASSLVAVDAKHAWALSGPDNTLATTDGVHWQSLGYQGLLRMSFVDPLHGFGIERLYYFMRTDDGGRTWTAPGGPKMLQSLCFADARTGWVARGGTVWTTHDAGTHWTPSVLLPTRRGFPVPELYCRGRAVWIVLHGGAAAGSEGYAVYRSRDAGGHWRAVYGQFLRRGLPRIDAYAGPLAVAPGGDAWLEGSCAPCGRGTVTLVHGRLRTTFDGWQPGPIAFADRRHGLLVLTGARTGVPSVWRTANGRTWQRVLRSRLLAA